MTEEQKLKRPTAHRWVIGLLWFMTVASAFVLSDVVTGTGASLRQLRQHWLAIAFLTGDAFALFCLHVGGRHRWAYYVTSGVLGIWSLRGIYNVHLYAWLLVFGKRPLNINHFQFSQRGQPFFVQLMMFLVNYLAMPASVALIVWLFVRFTFTNESRSYFQFKKRTANDAGQPGQPGKSTEQHKETPTSM